MESGGMIRSYNHWFATCLRLVDLSIVALVLFVLTQIYGDPWNHSYISASILGVLITFFSMQAVNLYRTWRGASLFFEFRTLLSGWMIVIVTLLLLAWATRSTGYYSRLVIGTWFIATPIVMALIHLGGRVVLQWLRRQGRNSRSAIIIGAGHVGKGLARRIQSESWLGVRLLGFFDDSLKKNNISIDGIPLLGKTESARDYVLSNNIDLVYLALPMRTEKKVMRLADEFQDTPALVYLVPDFFIFDLLGARMQEVAGIPVAALYETPFYGPAGMAKRMEDVIFSSLVLVLFSPLLLIISIAIKLDSRGPVIFRQRRYGLHGEEIVIWKFRSMTTIEDGEEITQAVRDDPRVTRLGCFLRRHSLDELPQFINVLRGEMSVVGPRPHAVAHNEYYRNLIKGYMWRHKVRPGITGWAQVNGWRGETDTLEKMKSRIAYDLEYIQMWSLWLDIKIIFLTVVRGFRGRNVY